MKLPVVVTLSMFIDSVPESVHSWSIYHMLRQLVPEIYYSIAVEMLSRVKSDTLVYTCTISNCEHVKRRPYPVSLSKKNWF